MIQLVDDAKNAWRWFSVQAMTAAGALLGAWELLPADLKAGLSESTVRYVAILLLVLGVAGRLVKQGDKP